MLLKIHAAWITLRREADAEFIRGIVHWPAARRIPHQKNVVFRRFYGPDHSCGLEAEDHVS